MGPCYHTLHYGSSESDCLCCNCSQEAMLHQKEQEFAAANEAMLAGFLARINHIADVVGQDRHADHADCAGKLRTAVEDLKTVRCATTYSMYSSAGRSRQLKILCCECITDLASCAQFWGSKDGELAQIGFGQSD